MSAVLNPRYRSFSIFMFLYAILCSRFNNKYLLYSKFGVKLNDLDSTQSVPIKDREAFTMLTFDHRGKYILGGTSKVCLIESGILNRIHSHFKTILN